MRISVIIPTLNNATLAATLHALLAQHRPADEIIVVGRDEIEATRPFPAVTFVDSGQPLCAAAARNLGLRHATGDLFLLTDADCLPAQDWIAQHERAQRRGQMVVGGGITLDHPNYWARSDNVAMFHEFATHHPSGQRRLLPTLNLSLPRAVWEAVGDMDESFPAAAGEDSDWTIRMRLAGYPLHFEPAAVVHHRPQRTTWRDVVRHWQRSGYNNIRVRLRYAADFGTPPIAHRAWGWRCLSPAIAAGITAKIYADTAVWPYWSSLPVVYLTKLIYCWSAAQAIDEGFATS